MVSEHYPAVRRYDRGRKPPRILLGSICTIACILFMVSAAMLTVGYLNPFGTIGLSILGVGAVLYFGTILLLVVSCLQVQKKYPGMRPLSIRIPTRRPVRPPPTTMGNPNISGQMPIHTITNYRTHDDLPPPTTGFKGVPEKPRRTQIKTNDTAEETNRIETPNQNGHVDPDSWHDLEFGDTSATRSPEAQASHRTTGDQGDLGVKSSIHVDGETETKYGEQQKDVKVDAINYSDIRNHAENDGPVALNETTVQSEDSIPELPANQDKPELSQYALQKRDSKGNRKTHHIEVPIVEEKHEKVQKENKSDSPIKSNRIDYNATTQSSPQTGKKLQSPHQERARSPIRKIKTHQWNEIHQDAPKTEPFSKPVYRSSSASPNRVRKHAQAIQKMSMSPPTVRRAAIQHIPQASLTPVRKTASPTRTRELIREHRVRFSQDITSSGSPPRSRKAASSSPPRHRQRSPDIPHRVPIIQDNSETSKVMSAKSWAQDADGMYRKKSLQQSASSSQSCEIPSSPVSSPLTAKKLLHYRKETKPQRSSVGTKDNSSDSDSSGPRRITHQQEIQQSQDKNQRSPRSRETSPAAAKPSPSSSKKSPSHQRRDQL